MSKFTHFLGGPTGPKICGRRAETNFKDLACCDHFVFNKTLTWLLGPWVWPHSPTGASGWCSRTRWSRPTPWTDARHKVPSSLFLLNHNSARRGGGRSAPIIFNQGKTPFSNNYISRTKWRIYLNWVKLGHILGELNFRPYFELGGRSPPPSPLVIKDPKSAGFPRFYIFCQGSTAQYLDW